MNTPEEHAAAVWRSGNPGIEAMAGAIRSYHAELIGELDRLRAENTQLKSKLASGEIWDVASPAK